MLTNVLRTVFSVILMGLVLPQNADASSRDQIVIGISQFPSNFNPLIDSMAAKAYILGLSHRSFTVFDAEWNLACMLCATLPTLENKMAVEEGNGVAVSYQISPDAYWGDGTPVTTKDVLFTWDVGNHPASGVSNGELFRRIQKIDVLDDRNFTLHVDRLTFNYNAINDFQLLPAHLEAKAFENPERYRQQSLYETDTTNPGLYNGPYRISKVARGQYALLERNAHWRGTRPAFDRIIIRAIESSPSLEANLLSGDIDMIAGEVGLTLDAALAFEKRGRKEWRIIVKPGLNYEHITVNFDNPALADKRVRQALLYGLDRQLLVKNLYQDYQAVAHGAVNPLDWMYDPDVRQYPHDVERARSLLEQAGWRQTAPGIIRVNGKGEKLSLELMTTAGMRNREIVQLIVQQAWRHIGIEITLRNQPPRVFFGETVTKRLFPAMAQFAWISSPENVPQTIYHSTMIPTPENNFAGQNVGGYENAEMDELLDRIEYELDRKKRRVLWKRFQALSAEELPDLPLTFRADAYILPVWLDGIVPTGHQYPTTLWVENWRVSE